LAALDGGGAVQNSGLVERFAFALEVQGRFYLIDMVKFNIVE
jgi:hypothetical protein